ERDPRARRRQDVPPRARPGGPPAPRPPHVDMVERDGLEPRDQVDADRLRARSRLRRVAGARPREGPREDLGDRPDPVPYEPVPADAAPPVRGDAPRRLAARLERALDLAVGVSFGEVAAFVAHLLAAGERELDLHAAVLEVEARRDERQAALADRAVE